MYYVCVEIMITSLRVVGALSRSPEKPLQLMCMCLTDIIIFCACPDMDKVGKLGFFPLYWILEYPRYILIS